MTRSFLVTLTLAITLTLTLAACAGTSKRGTAASGAAGCRIANFASQCVTP